MSRNGAGGVGQSPKSEVRGRKSTIRIDPSRPLRVGIRSWFWALEGATRAENWRKTTKFTKIGPETAFRGVLGLWRASKPDFRPSRPLLRVGRRKFTQMGGAGGEFWQENRKHRKTRRRPVSPRVQFGHVERSRDISAPRAGQRSC